MTGRRRLGVVAGIATLLAAAPLSTIFERWTWLVQCIIAVALITGAATLARSLRAPVWAQALSMGGALLLVLTWMFPSGDEFFAVLPGPQTFAWFGDLTNQATQDMRSYGVPVPDRDGLLFLTVLGVGGVAIVVDLLTVGLRRPALAGLPMLAIYSVPVAIYVESVPALPFVLGAVGYLWLLVADNVDRVRRFGRRFTGDGRDVDVWEPSPLAAAGRRLAVFGLAVAVLLPLSVPGLSTGLLTQLTQTGTGEGPGNGPGGGPGRVNLFAALSGQLTQSETTELVRLTTDEAEPYYLRYGVADVVSEQGFGSRPPTGRSVTRGMPDPRDNPRPGVRHQQHRATVEITGRFTMPMVPTYAGTVATENLDSSWFYDPNMQIVYSNRSTSRDQRYEFDYVRTTYSPAALRNAPQLPPDSNLRTAGTAVPQIREVGELVEGLIEDERTDYDKVRAIYDFFSRENGFSYSLQTETGTSGPEILAFLTSKVGYCQQYASAMAWLVREAGIPARVAFGFTRGQRQDDGTYVLTNRNLHAWTEVYFDTIGWVPFDATPAASVPGSTRTNYAPDADRVDPIDPAADPTAAPQTDPSAGAQDQDPRFRDVDEEVPGASGGAGPAGPLGPWLIVFGVAALALALLALPALRRASLRRRRHAATLAAVGPAPVDAGAEPPGTVRVVVTGAAAERARADAHAAWDELIDTMIDYRVPIDPTETPRLTAERLTRTSEFTGPVADAAALLGRAEERARYAREPLSAGRLSDALRQVRRALAARVGRRTRIMATLLPPSVLLRWRLAAVDTSARLAAGAARRQAALSRWNPRRLVAARASR